MRFELSSKEKKSTADEMNSKDHHFVSFTTCKSSHKYVDSEVTRWRDAGPNGSNAITLVHFLSRLHSGISVRRKSYLPAELVFDWILPGLLHVLSRADCMELCSF